MKFLEVMGDKAMMTLTTIAWLLAICFIVIIALLMVDDEPPCRSCAPDNESIIELRSPTIITPSEATEDDLSAFPPEDDIEGIIRFEARRAQLSESDADRLVAIAYCESRHDPKAKNKNSSARGLFQHLSFWADELGLEPDDFYDPAISTRAAIEVLERQGWDAWTCNSLV